MLIKPKVIFSGPSFTLKSKCFLVINSHFRFSISKIELLILTLPVWFIPKLSVNAVQRKL